MRFFKISLGLFGFCILSTFLMVSSCATLGTRVIPTLSFMEYALKPGPEQIQKKSDIEINLEVIQLSNIYNYPTLFSFRLDELPREYAENHVVRKGYRPGLLGRSWAFPFASPDGKMQLLFCFCKIKNNTEHILRMSDARIYLIVEGVDPLPGISSFAELLEQADYFQKLVDIEMQKQTVLYILRRPPLPPGFFSTLVLRNERKLKLINDLKAEILPGFFYEGILVFPAIPSFSPQAKVSFFDVTTKTNKAGNPIEKTQFDFNLQSQRVQMWYDRYERIWKVGPPPEIR